MANIKSQRPNGIGISSAIGTYEPATSKFFTITVNQTDLQDLKVSDYDYAKDTPATSDYILNNDASKVQEVLLVTCKKCTVPKCDINQIEIKRGNDIYKYPGMPVWNDITCEFNDFINSNIREILYAWKAEAYSTTVKCGPTSPADYKKTITLKQYTSYNKCIGTWVITGAWIKELAEPDLDVESDDARVISITFVYDYADYIPER